MENKCAKCGYGKRLNTSNEYYCGYLEIVGHLRPTKASDCDLHKKNPKHNKQDTSKNQIVIGSRYKAVLTKKK